MNNSLVIGVKNPSINYRDRPTVKALILNENSEVLIINDGLLPGGGVEPGEEYKSALQREINEELGISVQNILEIGTLIQYRDFLEQKYIVSTYRCTFMAKSGNTKPQDEGEASFTYGWYSTSDALRLVKNSIIRVEDNEMLTGDTRQGKIYNLMTTKFFLELVPKSS